MADPVVTTERVSWLPPIVRAQFVWPLPHRGISTVAYAWTHRGARRAIRGQLPRKWRDERG